MPDSARESQESDPSPGPHHAGAKRKYWDLEESTRYLRKGITEHAIENRGQQSGLVCREEWGSHGYRTGDRGVRHPQSIQRIAHGGSESGAGSWAGWCSISTSINSRTLSGFFY